MGKSTISMAIFNSYVKLPEGIIPGISSVIRMAYLGIFGQNAEATSNKMTNSNNLDHRCTIMHQEFP